MRRDFPRSFDFFSQTALPFSHVNPTLHTRAVARVLELHPLTGDSLINYSLINYPPPKLNPTLYTRAIPQLITPKINTPKLTPALN